MEIVNIKADKRDKVGTKWAEKVRKDGLIPGVIYGEHVNVHITVKPLDVRPIIYTPDFKLAEIAVDGEVHQCILKEIQQNAVTDEVSHIDFLKLKPGTKVKIEVPIRFTGNSEGVKAGGKFQPRLKSVKIKVDPKNIISEISVDIAQLGLGQTVRVKDIDPIPGVEILNPSAVPLASVTVPRALKETK